jgi:hypothetical protein
MHTRGFVASRLGGARLGLDEVARIIGSGQGTVSNEIAPPRLDLQEAALLEGPVLWETIREDVSGGPVVFSDASAECENTDSEDFLAMVRGPLVGCELRKMSLDGSARVHRNDPDDPERVIGLPALDLVGPVVAYQ